MPEEAMARRKNWKDKIGNAIYEKKSLNRKVLRVQKSFQEVKHLLDNGKK